MDRIVLEDECHQITTLSLRSRRREQRAGRFPYGVLLPDGTIGWLESDLLAWVDSRRSDAVAATTPRAPRSTPGPLAEAAPGASAKSQGGRRKAAARVL